MLFHLDYNGYYKTVNLAVNLGFAAQSPALIRQDAD
jgi:hypothetical protein